MGLKLNKSDKLRHNITKAQEAEIEMLYIQCVNELKDKVNKAKRKGGSYELKAQELERLRLNILKELNNINPKIENKIILNMIETSQNVVEDYKSWLKEIGLHIEEAFMTVSADVAKNVALGKIYDKKWFLSDAIWTANKEAQNKINYIISQGILQNRSAFDIAKDLESFVDPSVKKAWDWKKVYPNSGKTIEYNAQRLARTLVSHAYQQSLVTTVKHNPFIKGIKWMPAYTHRTCRICETRASEDGYGLGAGVFPPDKLPLDHPNGMCTYMSVMSEDMGGVADRLANWANGKPDKELDKWCKYMINTNDDLDVVMKGKDIFVRRKDS